MIATVAMAPAIPSAARFDALFWSLIGICGLVAAFVIVAMVVLVVHFHHRGARGDARPIAHHDRYEIAWTAVTFVIFAGIFAFGALDFRDLDVTGAGPESNREQPLEVLVTAKRWMWKFDHESGAREIDTLHVPAGRPIRLHMVSEDVIHSFFVPDFRVKKDVLPGRSTTLHFEADTPGRHPILCAEYCGLDHSRMRGEVVVMTPEDYAAWSRRPAPQSSPIASGERLFHDLECDSCHVDDGFGRRRGPALGGLFGSRVTLASGREVLVDEDYLRESILEPAAATVAGYESNMPPYAGRLSEIELTRLVLYIRSLRESEARP
jgi:cytochrome c oxidase subunit 2